MCVINIICMLLITQDMWDQGMRKLANKCFTAVKYGLGKHLLAADPKQGYKILEVSYDGMG